MVPNPKRTVIQNRISSFSVISLIIRYTIDILIPPIRSDRNTWLNETPQMATSGISTIAGIGG
jgi:hypothetical protein